MSAQTATAELARVKLAYPLWRIREVEDGWEATRGSARVWAASLGALEAQMRSAQRGMGVDPSHTLGPLRERFPGWVIARVESGWTAEKREGTALRFMFRGTATELTSALEKAARSCSYQTDEADPAVRVCTVHSPGLALHGDEVCVGDP